ncbi:hypothetical protein Nepgr_033585 [Nepenthes gracilis]|uniref:Uncharacterized protein n=1 Tax=Nepenthes gracilis TaxID=150966 RepID=A0AAD3Y920_NEPGR|nr:hypothetical protein Nepgr_033585 [Nepenthes gracilis]
MPAAVYPTLWREKPADQSGFMKCPRESASLVPKPRKKGNGQVIGQPRNSHQIPTPNLHLIEAMRAYHGLKVMSPAETNQEH